MRRPVDSQRQKVYDAEYRAFNEAGTDKLETEALVKQVTRACWPVKKLEDCRTVIEDWISQAWFSERWPGIVRVELADGAGSRRATGGLWYRGTTARIKLPRPTRVRWIMLHELAHVVTSAELAWHGREFCANYLLLVQHFLGREMAKRLKEEFKKGGVKYKPKMQLTDEQRQALRERFAKIRSTTQPVAARGTR